MSDYYKQDGRYFGEDTSFYEFDKECLEKKASECGACSDRNSGSEGYAGSPGEFDRHFTNRKLDLIKTAIPFLPSGQQKNFACAVKLAEFRNLVACFHQNPQAALGACSETDPGMRMTEMLEALRGYCTPAEQNQLDSMLQAIMTVQMMHEGSMQEL